MKLIPYAIAIVAILAVFSFSNDRLLGEDDGRGTPPITIDARQTLRQDMRKLWTDHTVWTRGYIIAAVGNGPDKEAASERLMQNQEDIGKASVPTTAKKREHG